MLIETPRLFIREFDLKMARDVNQGSLDDDTRKYLPDEVFETIEEAEETIDYLISQYHNGSPLVYPLTLKDDTYIGYVEAVCLKDGNWEVGYHINKEYRRKGYAKEALEYFVSAIMDKLDIDEIYGVVDLDNTASIRVLESCGFNKIFEGMARYHHQDKMIVKYINKRSRQL